MQALSFAVHIPLVAFGIAFPAMVLFVEWLHLRTGDPLYRTLARRWSRVMVALFAVGRDHRDDPQLRDGAAVAELHRHVRRRVRARVRDRGLLLLHGGDLHRDLRLRLGPAVAPPAPPERDPGGDHRLHRVADGDLGQRLDEPPRRLSPPRRQGRRRQPAQGAVRQQLPVVGADPHVHRRLHGRRVPGGRPRTPFGRLAGPVEPLRADRADDPADDRVPGRPGAGPGRRLGGARRGGRPSRSSWRRSRGSTRRPRGAPSTSSAGTPTVRSSTGSRSPTCCRCWPSTAGTPRSPGCETVPPDQRPPVNVVRFAFQTMVGIGTAAGAAGSGLPGGPDPAKTAARLGLVLPGGGARRARRRSWR